MDPLREIEERHPFPWTMSTGVLTDGSGEAVDLEPDELVGVLQAWPSVVDIVRRLAHAAGFTNADDARVDSIADLTAHVRELAARPVPPGTPSADPVHPAGESPIRDRTLAGEGVCATHEPLRLVPEVEPEGSEP